MAVAVEMLETLTGVVLFVVVPSPSCPPILLPQHWTVLFESSAQV